MKPVYENWVSHPLKNALMLGTIMLWTAIFACRLLFPDSTVLRGFLTAVLVICFLVCLVFTLLCVNAYDALDSNKGRRRVATHIVDAVADRVVLNEGQTCLDIGCGDGQLTIAVGRKNAMATIVGIDPWPKGADKGHRRCKRNAAAEGVGNVAFEQGSAIALDFDDGTFDAVVSNYFYHKVSNKYNKQDLITESLRVLKKGGTFVIHDIMNPKHFGDLEQLRSRLLAMGYERVDIVDTTDGTFLSPGNAKLLGLAHSTMLIGTK